MRPMARTKNAARTAKNAERPAKIRRPPGVTEWVGIDYSISLSMKRPAPPLTSMSTTAPTRVKVE